MKQKIIGIMLVLVLLFTGCNSSKKENDKAEVIQTSSKETAIETVEEATEDATEEVDASSNSTSVEDILARLTLEEKAAQMVQGAVYAMDDASMKKNDYGSILSTYGVNALDAKQWRNLILQYQRAAVGSKAGVPYIYGNDAVHGVNTCLGTVIFPHNIGIGAANNEELTYQMGLAVANEAKLTGMLWNFAPCLAAVKDPRWGRTYESYSSELDTVASLGTAYANGLIKGGILPCAKHFFADGNVLYGTGENLDGINRLIDRGDAQLTEQEIKELLEVYQKTIDTGVKSIMISHSSLNGIKMHANEKYIKMLKEDMGFQGVILSDWNSIHNIPGANLKEQTITAINASIDMLMEDQAFEECRSYIIEGVNEGSITMERVDDAVRRILTVKKEMGILDNPMMKKVTSDVKEVGSKEYRDLARTLVEESMVLLKNEKEVLPIRKGTKIFVTGPAANDVGVQCGGWTITWLGSSDAENGGRKWVREGKTILDGLMAAAEEYDLSIITDEKEAAAADLTLLCLGEKTYAEWEGDSEDISITGKLALKGNAQAIDLAKSLGHPTVACIVAGRNVIIDEYQDQWDGISICYLPGSEGDGVANVLVGKSSFKGKLPMPYYSKLEEIGTDQSLYPVGYGLEY